MIKSAYIHIPFCLKKCKYCSFCSFPLLSKKEEYINALISEIKYFYKNEDLKTIYFGGGTPSLLEACDIEKILNCFKYSSDTEITLELNPNDRNKIKDFFKAGINRLSVGVQSFDDEILKNIGRIHNQKEIFETIDIINDSQIENYSIDLMYGMPNQTLEIWEKTLQKTMEIEPKHVSLYGLKIEEGSYFYKNMPKNLPNDDLQASMYELALEVLNKKYQHYEFSNFTLNEKYFSKHNLTYWNCKKYYGFGLSASGYIDFGRYTNTFNYKNYINNPTDKFFEKLSIQSKIEEEIFLGLRVVQGIDFEKINSKYNIDIFKKYEKQFEKFVSYGFMEFTPKGAKLTKKGIMLSNEILCEFLN